MRGVESLSERRQGGLVVLERNVGLRNFVDTGTRLDARISAELLVKARRLGYRVEELGVTHYPREVGSPTGARLSVIVRAFKELFRLRLQLREELAASEARWRSRGQPA